MKGSSIPAISTSDGAGTGAGRVSFFTGYGSPGTGKSKRKKIKWEKKVMLNSILNLAYWCTQRNEKTS